MMMPSIFGEDLFDNWMDFPFDRNFFGEKSPVYGKRVNHVMKTDIKEKENAYEIDVDLPGFKKEEVTAQLKDGYLNISASRNVNNDEKNEDGKYIRRERYAGSMSRSFYVGAGVSQDEIHARFEDGILRLTVPKKDAKAVEKQNYIAIEG